MTVRLEYRGVAKRICWAVTVALLTVNLGSASIRAASLVGSSFTSYGLTSQMEIDVRGRRVVDWGYFTKGKNFYSDPSLDNSRASSGIGPVSVAKGVLGNPSVDTGRSRFVITFNDGTSPVSTNRLAIGADFGGWGGAEDNAATFTFNDLGKGTLTVRLYVGHSSNDRIFDMDYDVFATDGGLSGNTGTSSISNGTLHAVYEIVVNTADDAADLTLHFNSTSGGAGSGFIGGYVVERIPPPSGTVLVIR